MQLNIIFLYAGLLGMFLIFLSFKVIQIRKSENIKLLDGNNSALQFAIRAHGNFTEYSPMFLILFFILTLSNYPAILLHILGSAFIIGRILHAYSLLKIEQNNPEVIKFRFIGMVTTFSVIGIESIVCLVSFIKNLI